MRWSAIYPWYVVGVLMIAYTFSFVDRQIMNLMIGPIRAAFSLSDTEVSLLIGFAFALFYGLMGIPLGRMADRVSRRNLIIVGLALWSMATMACGFVASFASLFFMRMMVGVGEAVLNPSAYSIISDTFSREKLAKAMSLYAVGINLGSGLAFIFGGSLMALAVHVPDLGLSILSDREPWQIAIICAGAPGIVLIALIMTIKEPSRKGMLSGEAGAVKAVPLRQVMGFIVERRATFIPFLSGGGLISIMGYAFLSWTPEYFIRSHNWTAAEVGIKFGLAILILSIIGIYTAGALADRYVARGKTDGYLRVLVWFNLLLTPWCILMPLMQDPLLAYLFVLPLALAFTCPYGVLPAAIQVITPNQLRGQVSAFYMLCNNMIGLGFGPTIVALITDKVFQSDAALGYSLAIVLGVSTPLSAWCFYLAMKPFRNNVEDAQQWANKPAQ